MRGGGGGGGGGGGNNVMDLNSLDMSHGQLDPGLALFPGFSPNSGAVAKQSLMCQVHQAAI